MLKCFILLLLLFSIWSQDLKLGIIPMKGHPYLRAVADELKHYIEERSSLRVTMLIPESQEQFIENLQNKVYDIAYTSPYSFLISKRTNKDLTPSIILLQKNGKPYFRCKFITHKDSDIKFFTDLSNKSFAWGREYSMSSRHIPKYILQIYGIQHTDTSKDLNGLSSSEILKNVLNRTVDAASIHDGIKTPESIRILKTSFPIPEYTFIRDKSKVDKKTNELFQKIMLTINLKNTPKFMRRFSKHHKGFAKASISEFKRLYNILSAENKSQKIY